MGKISTSKSYDDFFDAVKPILERVQKEFNDEILHYVDINFTPSKYYHKKKKHEKILNYYKEFLHIMGSPILKLLLNYQHSIYDALMEESAPNINFKDEKVIPYDGEWNAYYLPGDIIRFTTTDVKMLNVKKTPFKYCFRKDNLPIRQLDINTKEHYLIIEIYYTKWGEATLLLKDHKGYLLAIDYPVGFSDENKEVIEVIDSIAPYDEELEDMRYEAYENDSKAEEAMREAAEEEEERKRIEKERLDNYIREVKFNC